MSRLGLLGEVEGSQSGQTALRDYLEAELGFVPQQTEVRVRMIRVRCNKDYSGLVRAFEGQVLSFDEETWERVQAETDAFDPFDVAEPKVSGKPSTASKAKVEQERTPDEAIDEGSLPGAPPGEAPKETKGKKAKGKK